MRIPMINVFIKIIDVQTLFWDIHVYHFIYQEYMATLWKLIS